MSIRDWLLEAAALLKKAGIPSPILDSELILSTTLGYERTYLHAHSDELLSAFDLKRANEYLERRINREPLAYIFGTKEFYGREFKVAPAVLIPRPETEEMIELLKQQPPKGRLLDIGTGSGIIGITAKLEFPELSVTLSDISPEALTIAKTNAKNLGAKSLRFVRSNLLEHWIGHTRPQSFDSIVANLPYVDENWESSPETVYEPSLALFAEDHGLQLIKKCILQSQQVLKREGLLLLEADRRQHTDIILFAKRHGLKREVVSGLIIGLRKAYP